MLNQYLKCDSLAVEIVFHPSWWYKHAGICFDEDFFFHPLRRVEVERQMEQELYERFGQYGLGENRNKNIPEVGAVHNAAGYLLPGMLGCKLIFSEDAPPEVECAAYDTLDVDIFKSAFDSPLYKRFMAMCESLKTRYGYLSGDVGWGGVLNTALDLRGDALFIDMFDQPECLKAYFKKIAETTEKLAQTMQSQTGSSSISVNRTVRHFSKPVFLHSECSLTMISEEQYEEFILPLDIEMSHRNRPFGIHYCGTDPHRFASSFAKIPHLYFLDVGWGGDLKILRNFLPDTFLNIRLSPVEIANQSAIEIENSILSRVKDSNNPGLTGVCCINMDDKISNEQVNSIFETIEKLKKDNYCPPE